MDLWSGAELPHPHSLIYSAYFGAHGDKYFSEAGDRGKSAATTYLALPLRGRNADAIVVDPT